VLFDLAKRAGDNKIISIRNSPYPTYPKEKRPMKMKTNVKAGGKVHGSLADDT
jgi:hypothetical protein